ncbi:hypothetical protein V6N12_036598 [Hibiscus sabdariffa]|uniref:F-box protein n=1 Tax=Hibiscus sabdariffa TaxID=183260 RepID=A0ABR2ER60_9ROSI
MESCFGYGRDMGGDRCGSRESVPTDIIDILQLLVHEGGDVSGCAPLGSDCNVVDILHSGNEDMISVDQEKEEFRDCEACSQGSGEAPHEALILALGYLGVRDLLVIAKGLVMTLMRVVENNPMLIKLSVLGCTRLSIEAILNSLKALKSMGTQGVKHLRVGWLFGVTVNHFEELKFLLGIVNQIQRIVHKPHFYKRRNLYLSSEDDRAIDIEMACSLCILRCLQCGQCINDSEYEESFSLEYLCSDCCKLELAKCHERPDRIIGPSSPEAGNLRLHG